MKEKLITVFALFFELATHGQSPITHYDLGSVAVPHNNLIPTITLNEYDITIKSDTILHNVDIVVRNQFGNMIHHSVESIGPTETIVYIPDIVESSEEAFIALYHEGKPLAVFSTSNL